MDFFATLDFPYAGRTVETGDDLVDDHDLDRRTIGHLLAAGWATAIPTT